TEVGGPMRDERIPTNINRSVVIALLSISSLATIASNASLGSNSSAIGTFVPRARRTQIAKSQTAGVAAITSVRNVNDPAWLQEMEVEVRNIATSLSISWKLILSSRT